MSKRSAYLLLTDRLDAIQAISQHTAGLDYDGFLTNRMARGAVVLNIQVLGEAANRGPTEFRDYHPEIEWSRIIRSRHILVHDYFGLDYTIIWRIITVHFPPLEQAIEHIFSTESFDDGSL